MYTLLTTGTLDTRDPAYPHHEENMQGVDKWSPVLATPYRSAYAEMGGTTPFLTCHGLILPYRIFDLT